MAAQLNPEAELVEFKLKDGKITNLSEVKNSIKGYTNSLKLTEYMARLEKFESLANNDILKNQINEIFVAIEENAQRMSDPLDQTFYFEGIINGEAYGLYKTDEHGKQMPVRKPVKPLLDQMRNGYIDVADQFFLDLVMWSLEPKNGYLNPDDQAYFNEYNEIKQILKEEKLLNEPAKEEQKRMIHTNKNIDGYINVLLLIEITIIICMAVSIIMVVRA